MPKCQFIDPKEVRKPGVVDLGEIKLNQYKKTFAEEKKLYSKDALLGIYQDMQYIREFETMLYDLKSSGSYQDVRYAIKDPLSLDIGREAVSVGEAYCLDRNDMLFSTEKSIGDFPMHRR